MSTAYVCDDHNFIRRSDSMERVNISDTCEELNNFIVHHVHTLLKEKYHMSLIDLPIPAREASGTVIDVFKIVESEKIGVPTSKVFCSANYATAHRLLIVVPSSGCASPGIWSRTLCVEQGLRTGSMINVVDAALSEGFGVVLTNPNCNSILSTIRGRSIRLTIPGSSRPEDHICHMWDTLIRECLADDIFCAFNLCLELNVTCNTQLHAACLVHLMLLWSMQLL